MNEVGSLEESDQFGLPAGQKELNRATLGGHYIGVDRISAFHFFIQFDLIIAIFGKEYLEFLRV